MTGRLASTGTLASWTTQQLVAFLGSVSACRDAQSAVRTAAESVALALDAEIGGVVLDDRIAGCIGFGRDALPSGRLLDACDAGQGVVEVPGVGTAEVAAARLGRAGNGSLFVARVGEDFGAGERATLAAMATVLGLTLDVLSSLGSERAAREESERNTRQVSDLLRKVREQRQLTLDRFSRIQRAIASRRPLHEVLDAIAMTAREIVDCDVAVVRITSGNLLSTAGLAAADVTALASPPVAAHLGRRAEDAGHAVIDNDFVGRPEAALFGEPRVQSAVAVPVLLGEQTVGHLLLASRQPEHRFAELDASLATTLAEHAGLAVQDAETVGRLHDALQDAVHKASHDPLTGLANRATFHTRLEEVVGRVVDPRPSGRGPTDEPGVPCVLYIDLDYFKTVNDTYGHLVGDQLLVVTAARLRAAVRDDDVVARLGGDEFAVIVQTVADDAEARAVAQRVYLSVCRPAQLHGEAVWPSASVGVAPARQGDTPNGLLARADLALYAAKRQGRGQVAMYTPDLEDAQAAVPAPRQADASSPDDATV